MRIKKIRSVTCIAAGNRQKPAFTLVTPVSTGILKKDGDVKV